MLMAFPWSLFVFTFFLFFFQKYTRSSLIIEPSWKRNFLVFTRGGGVNYQELRFREKQSNLFFFQEIFENFFLKQKKTFFLKKISPFFFTAEFRKKTFFLFFSKTIFRNFFGKKNNLEKQFVFGKNFSSFSRGWSIIRELRVF